MITIRIFFLQIRALFFQFSKKGKGDSPLPPLVTRLLLQLISKINVVIHDQNNEFHSRSKIYIYQSGFRTNHSNNLCLSSVTDKNVKGYDKDLEKQSYREETLAQVFSCKFCEISKNTFFHKTHLVAASRFPNWNDLN